MNTDLVVQTGFGSIRICSVWDFIPEVRVTKVAPEARDIMVAIEKSSFVSARYKYTIDGGKWAELITKATVVLKTNPMHVLKDLKKSLPVKYFTSKKVSLEDVLHCASEQSAFNMGSPTHFFPVGKNRYAILNVEDVFMALGSDFRQTLICTRPYRNFIIHAPNIKF